MVPIRTILDLIRAYECGFTAISASRELNIALPTAYKYYRRFKSEGFTKGKFQRNPLLREKLHDREGLG